jgi:phosphoribosylamine---glycine ligase
MNILILGSGGRECALAWKISQSPLCSQLFIAPGNGGTKEYGTNIDLSVTDFTGIAEFSLKNNIEMIVVGPEDPLVLGIVDYFLSTPQLSGIKIIGPDKRAAMLEGSKAFAKQFMQKHGIPTATYKTFHSGQTELAKEFLQSMKPPYVIKADGLAAGKGVLICQTIEEAYDAVETILVKRIFGDAGNSLVIEEFLHGIEMSAFLLTDGNSFLMLPEAKDYKRIGNHDTGPNTGGMGTISPVPFAGAEFMEKVRQQIAEPTLRGIIEEGMHYCGFIFVGLMNVDGEPKVIEYNVRLGDPETQSVLPRIQNDLTDLLLAASNHQLHEKQIKISPETIVNIVLASNGYPGSYEKDFPITLPQAEKHRMVFHAGTKINESGFITSGGRVLTACGTGHNLETAIENAYTLAREIHFKNKYFRSDIGQDLLKYIQ